MSWWRKARVQVEQHQLEGWTFLLLRRTVDLGDLDEIAARTATRAPLVFAEYEEDSDYAYCAGASDGRIDFRVLFNDHLANGYARGAWALERCNELAESSDRLLGWKRETAERIQVWAKRMSRTITPKQVLELIEDQWIEPSDATRQLRQYLGIPNFDYTWLRPKRRQGYP
jgi:hypothetical protein